MGVACCTHGQTRNAWKSRLAKLMGMDHAQKQAPNITVVWRGPWPQVQIWVSITDIFCIFLSSWRDGVSTHATTAAFQILCTSLTPPTFDATSTRNVVIRDKHSRKNRILYRRCHVRIYFNINSVHGELNQAKKETEPTTPSLNPNTVLAQSVHICTRTRTKTHNKSSTRMWASFYVYDRSTRYRWKLRNDGTKGINYRHTQLEYITYFLLATFWNNIVIFSTIIWNS